MTSQYVWIGIAVGVFFAGLGIGYAVLSANQPANFMHMNPQQMQQMMNNPQMMIQWHQTMMNNPQAMNTWMNTMMSDPQAMQQMHDMMVSNPQHMQSMMGPMMNTMMGDPTMQQQMMNMMMGNQGMMGAMMQNQPMMNMMMGNQGMMGNNMMGSGMMGGNMMMGNMMMGQPITRNSDVLSTIDNPYNPKADYAKWRQWDEESGYYTEAYVARLLMMEEGFDIDDELGTIELTNKVINDILENDPLNLYALA